MYVSLESVPLMQCKVVARDGSCTRESVHQAHVCELRKEFVYTQYCVTQFVAIDSFGRRL